MRDEPVIVIGAGMAGLTAALEVLARGRRCIVIEAAPRVGGCCASLADGAAAVEPAASVVIGRSLLAEVLDPLSIDLSPLLRPMQPIVSARWRGGAFDLCGPAEQLAASLAGWADRDAAAVERFVARMTELSRGLLRALWQWKTAGRLRAIMSCMPLAPWLGRSYRAVIRDAFVEPRLRRVLEAFCYFYAGLPAESAPAVLATMPALSIGDGCFAVRGGIQRLPEHLADAVRARGGEIRTAEPALRIWLDGDRATGVETPSGITWASAVIAACDVRRTFAMLPRSVALAAGRLHVGALRPSVAALSILATEDGDSKLPEMTWVIPDEPIAEAAPGLWPLAAISRTDGATGSRGIRIGGALAARTPLSSEEADAHATRLIDLIGGAGISLKLRDRRVWRPTDYEEQLGLPGGSAFSFTPSRTQLGPLRYGPGTPIANLAVAGQSTFPGFGIPLVAFSGKLAAAMVVAS